MIEREYDRESMMGREYNWSYLRSSLNESYDAVEIISDTSVETSSEVERLADPIIVHPSVYIKPNRNQIN